MSDAVAWLDGRLLGVDEPAVPAGDLGLRQGLGVFETMRFRDGRAAGLAHHLERLVAGGHRLGIAVDPATVRAGLVEVLALAPERDVVVRITVTAGDAAPGWPPRPGDRPRTLVDLRHAPSGAPEPADAAVLPGPRAPAGLADVKTTSYAGSVAAVRAARARGADVALLEEDGEIREAADGNVLLLRGDLLTTPPADGRILPGVTRRLLLELAPGLGLRASEAPLERGDLTSADLVVVSSAVRGLRPVARIDGVAVAGGTSHPALVRLRAALDAVRGTASPVVARAGTAPAA